MQSSVKKDHETQRLGCKVASTLTLEEIQKRAAAAPYEPTLEVVKKKEE